MTPRDQSTTLRKANAQRRRRSSSSSSSSRDSRMAPFSLLALAVSFSLLLCCLQARFSLAEGVGVDAVAPTHEQQGRLRAGRRLAGEGAIVYDYDGRNEMPLAGGGLPVAAGKELSSFPSVEESTVLFLHVFKCAGTTLREVLISWARSEGWTGAIVAECRENEQPSEEKICLNRNNDLIDVNKEKWLVRGRKVLAGHFLWDFRQYVTQPYLLITTLRNPLELFVSAQQFKHREQTRTFEDSSRFVAEAMKSRLGWKDPKDIGFIRRFLESKAASDYSPATVYLAEEYDAMVASAVEHLNTFWVVGVVEQYAGYIEVLKYSLDPQLKHSGLWETAHGVKNNGSPVHSSSVLSNIDPELVRQFNASTLLPQWQVYGIALDLWDSRCREVLPIGSHDMLCSVPQ